MNNVNVGYNINSNIFVHFFNHFELGVKKDIGNWGQA